MTGIITIAAVVLLSLIISAVMADEKSREKERARFRKFIQEGDEVIIPPNHRAVVLFVTKTTLQVQLREDQSIRIVDKSEVKSL